MTACDVAVAGYRMFDVGFSELVLLALIGLLVLGPKRLQTVAGELGRWIGSARRTC